jgi:hypothetical protein
MNTILLGLAIVLAPDNTPLLSDANMFPSMEVAMANWGISYKYYWSIVEQPACFCSDAQKEDARACYRAWDTLDNVRRGFGNPIEQLTRLREQIGYANYYSGRMPPALPIWWFKKVQ